jgi:hypothetical protein
MARQSKHVVIETITRTGAQMFHGPFKSFDEAWNWTLNQRAFANKHDFRWTYDIRSLVKARGLTSP